MDNYGIALGLLIKRERIKNNLTTMQLAKKTNFSRSYLSRIENGTLVNDFVYEKILSALNVTYHNIEECLHYEKELDIAYLNFIFMNDNENEIRNLLIKLSEFKSSPLFIKFMIIQLIYYVSYPQNEIECRDNFFREIETLAYSFSPVDQQLIYDYLGYEYMYKDVKKAKYFFDKAIECGVFDESTSMLYYHLSIFEYRCNHLCLALTHCMKAHDRFSNDLNYKRLFYTQFHIANIYMLNMSYDASIKIYNKLLVSDAVLDKSKVYANLSWALYKTGDYKNAYSTIQKCTKRFFSYYLNSTLINLSLNKTDEALSLINQFDKSSSNELYINILKIIQYRITKHYPDNMENLLTSTYKLAWKSLDISIVTLLNSYLVEYYEEHRSYKEANYYLKELLEY